MITSSSVLRKYVSLEVLEKKQKGKKNVHGKVSFGNVAGLQLYDFESTRHL